MRMQAVTDSPLLSSPPPPHSSNASLYQHPTLHPIPIYVPTGLITASPAPPQVSDLPIATAITHPAFLMYNARGELLPVAIPIYPSAGPHPISPNHPDYGRRRSWGPSPLRRCVSSPALKNDKRKSLVLAEERDRPVAIPEHDDENADENEDNTPLGLRMSVADRRHANQTNRSLSLPPSKGNPTRGAAYQKPSYLVRNSPPSPPPFPAGLGKKSRRDINLRRQLSAQSLRKTLEALAKEQRASVANEVASSKKSNPSSKIDASKGSPVLTASKSPGRKSPLTPLPNSMPKYLYSVDSVAEPSGIGLGITDSSKGSTVFFLDSDDSDSDPETHDEDEDDNAPIGLGVTLDGGKRDARSSISPRRQRKTAKGKKLRFEEEERRKNERRKPLKSSGPYQASHYEGIPPRAQSISDDEVAIGVSVRTVRKSISTSALGHSDEYRHRHQSSSASQSHRFTQSPILSPKSPQPASSLPPSTKFSLQDLLFSWKTSRELAAENDASVLSLELTESVPRRSGLRKRWSTSPSLASLGIERSKAHVVTVRSLGDIPSVTVGSGNVGSPKESDATDYPSASKRWSLKRPKKLAMPKLDAGSQIHSASASEQQSLTLKPTGADDGEVKLRPLSGDSFSPSMKSSISSTSSSTLHEPLTPSSALSATKDGTTMLIDGVFSPLPDSALSTTSCRFPTDNEITLTSTNGSDDDRGRPAHRGSSWFGRGGTSKRFGTLGASRREVRTGGASESFWFRARSISRGRVPVTPPVSPIILDEINLRGTGLMMVGKEFEKVPPVGESDTVRLKASILVVKTDTKKASYFKERSKSGAREE
ncbi:hypothetical protein HDU67_001011 [Dinochytrium kinnereticum]|nr:hypothetical protein HDU67_001011 [Dinochytrium kinnereticum]